MLLVFTEEEMKRNEDDEVIIIELSGFSAALSRRGKWASWTWATF